LLFKNTHFVEQKQFLQGKLTLASGFLSKIEEKKKYPVRKGKQPKSQSLGSMQHQHIPKINFAIQK
jgi:hypothetical protein